MKPIGTLPASMFLWIFCIIATIQYVPLMKKDIRAQAWMKAFAAVFSNSKHETSIYLRKHLEKQTDIADCLSERQDKE
jgi:hypothetical protein